MIATQDRPVQRDRQQTQVQAKQDHHEDDHRGVGKQERDYQEGQVKEDDQVGFVHHLVGKDPKIVFRLPLADPLQEVGAGDHQQCGDDRFQSAPEQAGSCGRRGRGCSGARVPIDHGKGVKPGTPKRRGGRVKRPR